MERLFNRASKSLYVLLVPRSLYKNSIRALFNRNTFIDSTLETLSLRALLTETPSIVTPSKGALSFIRIFIKKPVRIRSPTTAFWTTQSLKQFAIQIVSNCSNSLPVPIRILLDPLEGILETLRFRL